MSGFALHPEASAAGVAEREMAEAHVTMSFHFENPASLGQIVQRLDRSTDSFHANNSLI